MAERIPFYTRTLDSFSDEVITRQIELEVGWHAVLDCGMLDQVSDPDFSPWGYGPTRAEAASSCAAAIRGDARGIGKFAPHSVLVPGYDLEFRLMKHWEKKERLLEAGADANSTVVAARRLREDAWKVEGRWLEWTRSTKALEFEFQVCLAEMLHAVRELGADSEVAKAAAAAAFREAFADGRVSLGVRATDDTWRILDDRLEAGLRTLNPEFSASEPASSPSL